MDITRGLQTELEASAAPDDEVTERRDRRVAVHWLATRLAWEQNLHALRRATGIEGAGTRLRRSA